MSELTWNTQPGYQTAPIGSVTTKGRYATDVIDITDFMQKYANGAYENYGIALMNDNESSSSYFTKFFGIRHATAKYRPKLTVEYFSRPSKATTLSVAPEYAKPGESVKIKWGGITAGDLSDIQYRIAEYNEKENKEITLVKDYSSDTKIGTLSSGEGEIPLDMEVGEGAYKTYKVFVRGVSTQEADGEERGVLLKVDNADPTGTIRVIASGTGEETDVLKDTVTIIGEVDGTGSPVVKNYMKLYKDGVFVQDIYTNQTISKGQTVFTPELENGEYELRLYVEDSVGRSKEISKTIRVENVLAAPVISSVYSKGGPTSLTWNFPYAATEVCGIAYTLPGDETNWIQAEGASGVNGTFDINLPEEEGVYQVRVCGLDASGTRGAETLVSCIVDRTDPQAILDKVDRGLLYGTIQDANLSHWKITCRRMDSDKEEVIQTGKRSVSAGRIGCLDLQKLEMGVSYEVVLKVYDKAGNEKTATQIFTRQEQEIPAEIAGASFVIKRPRYTAHDSNHIVFPMDCNSMTLESLSLTDTVPKGTIRWYCNGKQVSTGEKWDSNFPALREATYSILAVIENSDGFFYSQNLTKNQALLPVKKKMPVKMPDNCVSFRLNTGNSETKVEVAVDGKVMDISDGDTIYAVKAFDGEKATISSVKVLAIKEGRFQDDWILEADTVDSETFTFSEMENYHPTELGVKDKLNYKTYLRWKGVQGTWPEDISYEIYRGQEPGFTPSSNNMIASNVKANYWAEMNVNYSRTFYYRVRAVRKDKYGRITDAGSYSNEVASTVVDANEYVKRMGLKEYWEYAEFTTPSGNGYVEKSKGNLFYTQVDAQIPNEQLAVSLERAYNSQSTAKTAFGVGWTHSFDMELLNICRNDTLDFKDIVLKDGTGTLFFFDRNQDGTYTSSMGKYMTLKKEDKTDTVELPDGSEIGVANKTRKVEVISSFTMTTKDNVEYRFNSGGQLIYMAEPNGNFLLFEHDADKGMLSKVTTSKNLKMEFVYYTEDDYVADHVPADVLTVKEVLLPDGSKISYEYAFTVPKDKDAKETEDAEVLNYLLTKVTKTGTDQKSKLSWTLQYNAQKQLVGISDAMEHMYTIDYDGDKVKKVTYPNGEGISLDYDEKNNRTETYKEISEGEKAERILLETNTFDTTSGNSINMTDSHGNSVTYQYVDGLRTESVYTMIYQEIEENTGRIIEKQTTKTDTTTYSSRKNVTEETDEDGIKTTYTYNDNAPKNLKDYPTGCVMKNAEGNPISKITYTYDGNGNVIRTYDEVDGSVVETTYYEEDNPKEGKVKGEIQSQREYRLTDQANQRSTDVSYEYQTGGIKKETIKEIAGQYTVTTTRLYDVMGREISSKDNLGTETKTEYDPFGRVQKIMVNQGGIEDVVKRQYDANGTLIWEQEEDGSIYTYAYDNMNRVVEESIEKDNEITKWMTEYTYDTVNINTGKGSMRKEDHVFITTEKNQKGKILEETYTDVYGKTIRQKKNGVYVDYTYDRENHVLVSCLTGTDPSNPEPTVTVYLYDQNGNASGQVLNPEYDEKEGVFRITDFRYNL